MNSFPCLVTVYFYEVNSDGSYQLCHDNLLIYADNFAHAARQVEEAWPEAERMDINLYQEGSIYIPDEQMDTVRKILEDL